MISFLSLILIHFNQVFTYKKYILFQRGSFYNKFQNKLLNKNIYKASISSIKLGL